MHIAICDDDPRQAQALHDAVAAWAKERSLPCRVEEFPSGEALWFACEGNDLYSILLLDVEMPGISGIELARRLRSSGSRAEIVFVTSHFELAGEGYEVDALHYLIKPVSTEKLFSVLDKAADRLAAEPNGVVITCGGETVKLYESDILYAESFPAQPRLLPGPPLLFGESEGRAPHRPHRPDAGGRGGDPLGPWQIRRGPPGLHRPKLR